jgi:ketosteroid isomerase-like protein
MKSEDRQMAMTLEARVQKVEDILEIMNLQAVYGSYLDKGWGKRVLKPQKVAELYVEDCMWECEAMGASAKGREQIVGMFDYLDKTNEFYMHVFTTPMITVNGNTAYAEWLMLVGGIVDGKVALTYANENIDYVKTEAGWRLKTVRVNIGNILAA